MIALRMLLAYMHERLLEVKWDCEKKKKKKIFRTKMVRQLIVKSWTHFLSVPGALKCCFGKMSETTYRIVRGIYKASRCASIQFLFPCPLWMPMMPVWCHWFLHWASLVAQLVKNLPAMWETWVRSLGWEDPLEQEMQPPPVFLPGESHGQRSLAGYSPWGCRIWRNWVTFTFATWKICFFFSAYSCLCSPYWCFWLPGLGGRYHEDLTLDWHKNRYSCRETELQPYESCSFFP